MARKMDTMNIIEELAMENVARAMCLEDGPLHPEEVKTHLRAIRTASLAICSYTSGLRKPTSPVNARLAEVLG